MKQITFIGKTYSVPSWAKYITQSRSGLIEAWKFQPKYDGGIWEYGYDITYNKDNHTVLQDEFEMIIEEIK